MRLGQHGGRDLGQAGHRGLGEALAVGREVQRLAHLGIVERRLGEVQEHAYAIERRATDGRQVLGPVDELLLLRREEVDEVVLVGDDGAQRGVDLGDDVHLQPVEMGLGRLPVFVVTRVGHLLVVVPAHELHRAGADGLAIVVLAQLLHRLGELIMPARSDRISSSAESGLLQLDRDLLRAAHLDAVDRDEVALDVGALVGAGAVEVELHRRRVERRAVMEGDAGPDVQHQCRRIGVVPGLGETGQRLQGRRLEVDQGVEDRIEERVVRARAAGRRIEARRVGVGRDLQHAALLLRQRGPGEGEAGSAGEKIAAMELQHVRPPMTPATRRRSAACPADWACSL